MARNSLYLLLIPLLLACGIIQTLPSVNTEIHTNTIATAPSAEPTDAPVLTGVVCNSGGLNVRVKAGTDNEVLTILPDGTPVTMTGQTQIVTVIPWLEITSPLHGWVFSRYICEVINDK